MSASELIYNLPQVIDSCGQRSFGVKLLELLSELLTWRYRYVVVYDRKGPPSCPFQEGSDPKSFPAYWELFEAGLYRFDPIYRLSCETDAIQINRLSNLRDEASESQSYYRFLNQQDWSDDISILLPLDDTLTLSVGWGWSQGKFSDRDVEVLDECLPLIRSLLKKHVQLSGQNLAAPSGNRQSEKVLEPLDYKFEVEKFTHPDLTDRENSAVQLTLLGMPNATISERFSIGHQSVKNLKSSIYRKLDITTERELFLTFFESVLAPQSSPNSDVESKSATVVTVPE